MKNPKIYYIHGYLSSPDSTKGSILKKRLGVKPVKYRDCETEDLVISDCIKRINDKIKNDPDPILIGSSLGGFLTAKIALENSSVKKIVLFNPAILPKDYDISKISDMPQRILSDMKEPRFFSEKINAKILILMGTQDDVVPNSWVKNFAKIQKAELIKLDDDHSLSQTIYKIPNIIKDFLKKD